MHLRAGAPGQYPARAVLASAWSIVRLYLRLTCTTRFTYQHWFRGGSHSARSLSTFWCRFTLGLARVRLSRSLAKVRRVLSAGA